MEDLESYKLWKVLLGIVGFVLLYYAGTRGVLLVTRQFAGHWYRRATVSLSFAVLFAPSIVGFGAHGGLLPAPAWMTTVDTMSRGRWTDSLYWGLMPIGITWLLFFGVASLISLTSNNNNNNKKVDSNGEAQH